jgi:hypothetical protein
VRRILAGIHAIARSGYQNYRASLSSRFAGLCQ